MSDFLAAIARQLDAAPADDDGRTAIWEPITFAVGDRVRVHLSGECAVVGEPGSDMARQGVVGCPREFDGLIGRVADVNGWRGREPISGHHIHVLFDRPVRWCGYLVKGDIFAASELIRLGAAAAGATDGGE